MKKFWLLIFFYVLPAYSQPVVPNFVTGTMSSTTNTTTSITETITSKDYKTGYEYTVSGTGITNSGGDMSPNATTVNGSSGGVTYTWTGADLTTKPNWTLTDTTSGAAFQFSESYHGPGLQNVTTITRQIESESVVTSTSVFSQ
tara:strand:+ start:24341 stop:24772 length:432 start_codon:yes stop_codon:yes gene_type:complete